MANKTHDFSERLRCAATAALPGFKVECTFIDLDTLAAITVRGNGPCRVIVVLPVLANVDEITLTLLNARLTVTSASEAHTRVANESDDSPPWSGACDASNALKSHADACAAKAERLNETLDDDAISDLKVFQAMRKASASRAGSDIVGRLVGEWKQHTEWHFSTIAPCGTRIDLWPSTCKAQAHVGDGEFSRAAGARHVTQFLRNYKVMK